MVSVSPDTQGVLRTSCEEDRHTPRSPGGQSPAETGQKEWRSDEAASSGAPAQVWEVLATLCWGWPGGVRAWGSVKSVLGDGDNLRPEKQVGGCSRTWKSSRIPGTGKGRDSNRRMVGVSSVGLGSPMLSNKSKHSYFSVLGFLPHPSDTNKEGYTMHPVL